MTKKGPYPITYSLMEELYQEFLTNLPNPALILDSAGWIKQCNGTFLTLYDLSITEIIGSNLFTLNAVNPSLPPFKALNEDLNSAKSTVHTKEKTIQTIQWNASLIHQGLYKNNWLLLGFDISAVMKNSLQVENIKRTIIDHIPNHYIFWKDVNSVYQGCNEALATSLGLKNCAEIVGKTDYDLPTSKEQSDAFRADDRWVMETKQAKLDIEETQTLADGTTRVLSTSKTPLFNEYGEVTGVLAIYYDITEHKELEKSLKAAKELAEEASRAKTEFIANMSHDIRTPLSGIIGMSNLLEQRIHNAEEKEYAQMINICGEQLYTLLNSVLEIIETGHQVEHMVQQTSTDIRKLINSLKELSLPSATIKDLTLTVHVDETVPEYLLTDSMKLHRILLNLIGNAIKFTKQGGIAIQVRCREIKEESAILECAIVDTGIGIAPKEQEKVFERFYRTSGSYRGQYSGFGIGLHIVQQFVSLLKGEITLESCLGKGTTFTVSIPVLLDLTKTKKQELPKAALAFEPVKTNTSNALILLIEDNTIALKILEALVEQAHCHFFSAQTAEEALSLIDKHAFNLIITDIGLPGMSGLEFASAVRFKEQKEHLCPIPIIGLTAHKVVDTEADCLKMGINKVITKPIKLEILKQLLDEFHYEIPVQKTLGKDLPPSSEELFQLSQYPLLDVEQGLLNLDSLELLTELLNLMINQALPADKKEINEAYLVENWPLVEKIAHKIKSATLYCGTTRLQFASQYLERYHQAGHRSELDNLYQQLLSVMDNTETAIRQWLVQSASS